MSYSKKNRKKGFTLIETLVGVSVFLIVATATYQAYISLFNLINLNQYKILALNLANEQFEIIRNMSYSDVGEVAGIPNGKVPPIQNIVRGGVTFTVTTTIRNIDLPFDGKIGGSPNDLSPADNKLAEVRVDCSTCKNFTPVVLTTSVAPKNLETASTNGALFVKVFDANGQPIEDANVHIVNSSANPDIVIDDVTDINGMLQVVDVPPGSTAYAITVSKSGYSTSRTYPPGGAGNPNPSQPDVTVLLQQVTQVSFNIDRLSAMSFSSVTPTCSVVGGIDFSMKGSKNIGEDVPKYSQNLVTDGSGKYSNSSMEWDGYTVFSTDSIYDIVGINPTNSILLNPNSSQDVQLIVASKSPKTLLVTVKDSSTGLPVADALVALSNNSGYSSTQTTDRGYINQTDWSGGAGQETYVDTTMYLFDDGSIDIAGPTGEIKLKSVFGNYNSSGVLESSTIDTGSASYFGNLHWSPTDQPPQTGENSVKFQFATNKEITSTTTWDYKGPNGQANTYYDISDSVINSLHNGDRYARYKVFLSSLSTESTPNVSDIAFTYTSSCTPPGQVAFSSLSGSSYSISVSKTGYGTYTNNDVEISSDWKEMTITLSPQ